MAASPGVHDSPRRLAPVVAIDFGGYRERVLQGRDDLVNRHAHIVPPIARKIKRRAPASVSLEDLIAVGNLALTQAATRFRPDAHGKPPFDSYARPWIRGAMLNSISGRNWTNATLVSIDASHTIKEPDTRSGETIRTYGEYLTNDEGGAVRAAETHVLARRVEAAIALLPAEQREVMTALYADDEPSLAEIGRRSGIGPRRAQRLHSEALSFIRDVLEVAV